MLFQKVNGVELSHSAKWAFTTRRVVHEDIVGLTTNFADAKTGDLVLARVEKIGSHKRIQITSGRPSELYRGDLVVLVCGSRYAPDQYEGHAKIDPDGSDLLAGGGVIGVMREANKRMAGPTRVIPVGVLCGRDGNPVNLADYSLPELVGSRNLTVIAAVGASMNAGKTTAVASFAHGLSRAGYRVATIKATGTGAYGDYNAYVDAGADYVADFVDAGMVSTYMEPISRIMKGTEILLDHAADNGCEIAIVELADGIFQGETAALLNRSDFRTGIDGFLFAAPCAASTAGGCSALRSMNIEPSIVTGIVSCSPLATKEAEAAAGTHVVKRESLIDPVSAGALLARIRTQKKATEGTLGIKSDEQAA